jgi:hypothetical protein
MTTLLPVLWKTASCSKDVFTNDESVKLVNTFSYNKNHMENDDEFIHQEDNGHVNHDGLWSCWCYQHFIGMFTTTYKTTWFKKSVRKKYYFNETNTKDQKVMKYIVASLSRNLYTQALWLINSNRDILNNTIPYFYLVTHFIVNITAI